MENIDDLDGFVYIARAVDTDLYKIGLTRKDPKIRFGQIQTSCPHKLCDKYIYAVHCDSMIKSALSLERLLHATYALYSSNGEWFQLSDERVDAAKEICEILTLINFSTSDIAKASNLLKKETLIMREEGIKLEREINAESPMTSFSIGLIVDQYIENIPLYLLFGSAPKEKRPRNLNN